MSMDPEALNERPDYALDKIGRQDLYVLSVGDLEERIANLKAEIARCEKAIAERGSTKAAADKFFKF
jgi:uncharacterized small protein (DUF1192 family)